VTAAALLVIAKAPVPGRSKTRLCPPCTTVQAAALAQAALRDTLAVVAATPAARRVLVLDGEPGAWLPAGIDVVTQRGGGLAERLAFAFDDAAGGPALLIGMDTPQVTPFLLQTGLDALGDGARSVLGLTADGGYWAIGLRCPDPTVFAGVPMSASHTGAAQRTRLRRLGLDPVALPILRDVDRITDAIEVAALAPGGRFARTLHAVTAEQVAV
jgi:rSAM/selenodomain-associated transferase 1